MKERTKNILLTPFNILYKISPEKELKLLFLLKTGKRLDLNNPKSFNEKINWLKLYDSEKNKEIKAYLSDKFTVRQYVEKVLGNDKILNQLYWEGRNPEEIPFDTLPDKFVIKVTHGSTFNIICKDKAKLNKVEVINNLKRWLKTKYLIAYGESWYGKVEPRIIVERYLENKEEKDLVDYKVFCFNGEPKLIHVHTGRGGNHKRNVYDNEWNHLDDVVISYPQDSIREKPKVLNELLKYAKVLSKGFAHVRVDFYIVEDNIIFSEFTFATGAGFSPITPYEHNLQMGRWIKLEKV